MVIFTIFVVFIKKGIGSGYFQINYNRLQALIARESPYWLLLRAFLSPWNYFYCFLAIWIHLPCCNVKIIFITLQCVTVKCKFNGPPLVLITKIPTSNLLST
jgi:hypothetical protein